MIRWTLRVKLVLGLAGILTTIMGLSLLMLTLNVGHRLVEDYRHFAIHLSDVAEAGLENAMVSQNPTEIMSVIQAISRREEVEGVLILNKQGTVRYALDEGQVGQVLSMQDPACRLCHDRPPTSRLATVVLTSADGVRILRVARHIPNQPRCQGCHQEKVLGVLVTDFSLAETDRQVAATLREQVLWALVTMAGAIGAATSLVHVLVTKPLEHFVKVTRAVGEGDLSRRVGLASDDEIGELAVSFDDMVHRVAARTRDLETLNAVAAMLSQSLDLKEVLEVALEETLTVLNAEGGLIYLFDETSQTFAPAVHRGISQDVLREVTGFKVGEGLSGWVAESGEALVVADLGADPRNISPSAIREGWRSYAGVPIESRGKVLGVMILVSRQEGHFGPDQVDLLSNIGHQIGVAMENARLFEDTQQRMAELEALRRSSLQLTSSLDLPAVLDGIAESALNLVGATDCHIYLYDEATEAFTFGAALWENGRREAAVKAPRRDGFTATVAREGRPIVINDAPRHPLYATPEAQKWGLQAIAGFPLKRAERVLGVFTIAFLQPHTFSEEELRVLGLLADQAVIVIENARLYQTEAVQRREAQSLREATLALTTTLDRNQVIERILSQLQQVVPYDAASVQLLRDDKLEIIGGHGFPNLPELLGISFPVDGDNPNREVVHTRAPFILEDAPTVYAEFRREPHAQANIHSWLGVPMLVGERLVGMIALDKTEVGFYTEKHARLALAFATQAAIAIENARLFEEEQRRATQLAVINELGRHAASTLELDEILDDVTLAIQTGFGYYNVATFLVEGEYAVLKAIAGGFAEALQDGYRQHLSQGLVGWAITHDQTVLAGDVSRDPRFIQGYPGEVSTRSELCVPIRVEGKVVGALDVQSSELEHFDQWDVRALETLADQVALAFKNALAYGRLGEEKGRLELLYQVAAEVNSTLELDEILSRAIETITTRLGGQRGYVFLVEPGTDHLRLRAAAGVEVSVPRLNAMLDVHLGQGLVGWVTARGEAAVVDDVTRDERWLYVDDLDRGIRSAMTVPLVRGEERLGALSVLHPRPGFFDEAQCRLLMAIAQQVAVAVANARLHEAVLEQARLDSLTQVYNHGELIERLHEAVEKAAREDQPVSFIMMDIDYFKEYNDRYGHVTGDLILRTIVQAIRANIKQTDIVGRWGGEEFGIVLPNTNSEQAQLVAERIRHTLATMPLTDDKGQEVEKPTVSQGIATYPTSATLAEELIDLADAALYRAKARGRDQVQVVPPQSRG